MCTASQLDVSDGLIIDGKFGFVINGHIFATTMEGNFPPTATAATLHLRLLSPGKHLLSASQLVDAYHLSRTAQLRKHTLHTTTPTPPCLVSTGCNAPLVFMLLSALPNKPQRANVFFPIKPLLQNRLKKD